MFRIGYAVFRIQEKRFHTRIESNLIQFTVSFMAKSKIKINEKTKNYSHLFNKKFRPMQQF